MTYRAKLPAAKQFPQLRRDVDDVGIYVDIEPLAECVPNEPAQLRVKGWLPSDELNSVYGEAYALSMTQSPAVMVP